MTRQRAFVVWTATILMTSTLASAQVAAPAPGAWETPACRRIVGTSGVTFTSDDGATLASTTLRLRGTTSTLGLAALDVPNVLLAVQDRTLLRSANAGCRWTSLGDIPSVSDGFPLFLTAAPGGRAYAWADNRPDLARVDGTVVTPLRAPVASIIGLAADGTNGDVVRLAGDDGTVWESTDGGGRWSQMMALPSDAGVLFAYRAAFDPSNLDHIVFGTAVAGAFVTHDGGKNWTTSAGFNPTGGSANVFQVIFSPADPRVVWAMGLNFAEYDAGDPSEGKHIYRSTDGGDTFTAVVTKSADVTLVNGPVMAAHPTDADVLYFVFGTGFANYGTDLFRYDAATATLTHTHNAYDGVDAIAFNPTDPSFLYLGLTQEIIGAVP
jgi:hypothetical protein